MDVIGHCGAPVDDAGFGLSNGAGKLTIGAGRYYVDGMLCENEGDMQTGSRITFRAARFPEPDGCARPSRRRPALAHRLSGRVGAAHHGAGRPAHPRGGAGRAGHHDAHEDGVAGEGVAGAIAGRQRRPRRDKDWPTKRRSAQKVWPSAGRRRHGPRGDTQRNSSRRSAKLIAAVAGQGCDRRRATMTSPNGTR